MKLSIVLLLLANLLLVSFNSNAETVDTNSAAYKVAETVDFMVRAVRAMYTKQIIGKLQSDNEDTLFDNVDNKRFTPLPAQFIHDVDNYIKFYGQRSEVAPDFSFSLRSKWNLNDQRGLSDNFETEGWNALEQQQLDALNSGIPYRDIEWKPYAEETIVEGKTILRYLSADTATEKTCIDCHNRYENTDRAKSIRESEGVISGKEFQLHELMGALSIIVTLE